MKKQWRAFYAEVDSYTINSKPSLKLLHNLPNNASAPLHFTPYSGVKCYSIYSSGCHLLQ